MGFTTALTSLCNNIRKNRPNLTEAQVRAEAERYLNGPLRPMYSVEEIFQRLNSNNHPDNDDEQNVDEEEQDIRREGAIPKLTQYSDAERKVRRERATTIRNGMYTYIQYQLRYRDEFKYKLNEGGRDPRDPKLSDAERQAIEADARIYDDRAEQHFFYYVPPTASQEEKDRLNAENEQIAFLFDTNPAHWEKYYKDSIAEIRKNNDPAYADKTDEEIRAKLEDDLATLRGQAIMRRAHVAREIADQAEAMSDPSLPAEQLAENFLLLMQEETIAMESRKITEVAEKTGRYKFSEADMEFLLRLDHDQVDIASAADRIGAYGNPMTEFIDLDAMAAFDAEAFSDVYTNDTGTEERGIPYYNALERKHSHYKQYVTGDTLDILHSLTEDAEKKAADFGLLFLENYPVMMEANGFTLGEGGAKVTAEHFDKDGNKTVKENAGVDELKAGRPLVVEQDGRMAVLCQRYPTSTELVWDKPEKLFNYSLRYENDKLLEQVAESDKWYKSRSTAFKEMRQSFEAIAKLTKDGLTENPQQRKAVTEKYSELLLKTEAYLEKKRKEGVGDGHNDVEQGHIRVAKALKQYALDKLGDLEIVDKASNALERYAGMSPEEKRKAAKRDLYNAQQKDIREDMTQWLKDQCAAFPADLPQGFLMETKNRAVMLGALLEANRNEEWVKPVYMCSEKTEDFATYTVGSMIAAEMVKNEREQRLAEGKQGPGAFETRMQNDYRGIVRELGEAAARYTVGAPKGEMVELFGETKQLMSHEQFTEFLTIFNTEEMAREMPEARAVQQRVEAEQREAQERAEQEALAAREAADKPLREEQEKLNKVGLGIYTFAQKDIVPLMDKLRGALADGQTTYGLRDSVDLLSSYVILGMIQLEELGGSSKLTRTMRDDEAAKTLQVNVQLTDGFRNILKEIATEDGNAASIEKISKALTEKKPQELARQILTDTKFKQSLESNMKAQGIEHSKGFKLGDKPPVNGKNEPPVMGQH